MQWRRPEAPSFQSFVGHLKESQHSSGVAFESGDPSSNTSVNVSGLLPGNVLLGRHQRLRGRERRGWNGIGGALIRGEEDRR